MPGTETYEQPTLTDEVLSRERERASVAQRWGVIFLALGIIWLVFELTGRGALFWLGFGIVERTERIAQELPGSALTVDLVGDDVELVQWERSVIRVDAVKHAFGWSEAAAERGLQQFDVQIELEGDMVRVTTRGQAGFFLGRAPFVTLRIAVPANTRLDVQSVNGNLSVDGVGGEGVLRTTNGAITGKDLEGRLIFKTTNGDITLEHLAGVATLETVNGDVHLRDGRAQRITASSMNGDLTFRGVTGMVQVRTINGDVTVDEAHELELDVKTASGDLDLRDVYEAQLAIETTEGEVDFQGSLSTAAEHRIKSFSGDVTLVLPRSSNLELEVSTLSGDLETDFGLPPPVGDRREARGAPGGGGTMLWIETTSGDVEVRAD